MMLLVIIALIFFYEVEFDSKCIFNINLSIKEKNETIFNLE